MRIGSLARALVVAPFLAAGAALRPAIADVDVAIGNGDKVTGTLSPANEVETFRVNLLARASLNVSVKGKKTKGAGTPVTTFRILDPMSNELLPFQPTAGTGAKFKGFVAPATGEYRIEVKGDGVSTGDYLLGVSWKSPTRYAFADDLGGGPFDVAFDAEAGARATLFVKTSFMSLARPRFTRLLAGDASLDLAIDAPAGMPKQHKVKSPVLTGGSYTAFVADGAAAGGMVEGTITVKSRAPVPRSLVITDAKIGPPGVGQSAIGAVVGAAGGTIAVEGTSLAIEGASIQVPAGGVSLPTAFVIATTTDLPPKEGQAKAGPPVFFGPEGLKLASDPPTLVTLPFNAAAAGGDAGAVRVLVRDAKGKVKEVEFEAPYPLVDLVAGSVTFPVLHFSSYQVFTTAQLRVRGDLDGDGFADLVVPASDQNNAAGRVYVFRGGPTLASGTSADADLVLDGLASDDTFGRAVVTGDFDEDGIDDLAVSGRIPRRVQIWFGGPGFMSGGAPDVTLTADAGDNNFGSSLAVADLHGNAGDELIVGDESSDRGVSEAGAVFVFRTPITANLTSAQAHAIFTGAAGSDLFGAAVAGGDVLRPTMGTDGNRADLVIGADQEDNNGPGVVYIFRGPIMPGLRAASAADVTITGETAGDGFGLHIGIGDVDGGGFPDLAVGAAGFDASGVGTGVGKLYLFNGEAGILSGGALSAQDELIAFTTDDAFGASVVVADIHPGGGAEVLVGSPGYNAPHPDAGAVWIARFQPMFLVSEHFEGRAANDRLGSRILASRDLDGDGVLDIVIGSPADDGGGADAGAVFVFFGQAAAFPTATSVSSAPIVITGASPGDKFGGD